MQIQVLFNWNVPILVGNDYWTYQEAFYTNKPLFTIMYSIFGSMVRGLYYEIIIGN